MMAHRRSTSDIDRALGQLLRERREELGMSQRHVARQLGVTYQQIQKYERGIDRIAASRLSVISRILKVPILYFYGASEGRAPHLAEPEQTELVAGNAGETNRLLAAYRQIDSPGLRRLAMAIVVVIGQHKSRRHSGRARTSPD
jgi:transcriptional regulator with XRE-family HTH domain